MSEPLGTPPVGPPHKVRLPARQRDPAAAWQRWAMGEVGSQAAASASPEEPSPAPAADEAPAREAAPAPAHMAPVQSLLPGLSPLQPTLLIDENELARLRQQAHAAGHAQGWREGHALGEQEGRAAACAQVRAEADRLAALARSLPPALARADADLAADLVSLAMALARQLVGQSLALQPEAVLAAVRALLEEEPALSGRPLLWLHPDDAALVQQHLRDELQQAGWRVRTDARIERGGCRVQASGGEIDATLPARWARLSALVGCATSEPTCPPAAQDSHD